MLFDCKYSSILFKFIFPVKGHPCLDYESFLITLSQASLQVEVPNLLLFISAISLGIDSFLIDFCSIPFSVQETNFNSGESSLLCNPFRAKSTSVLKSEWTTKDTFNYNAKQY